MSDDLKSRINVCLAIGFPIENSKSPLMHTAGFKALGIEDQFSFYPALVKPEDLEKTILAARKANIRGISVTMPHKQTVIKYLDVIDDDAEEIGAVNTIVNEEGELTGYNTDWMGAITALEKKTNLHDKTVAVIGGGGAARAIVFGLMKKETVVTVFNRSVEKAQNLAKDFGCEFGRIENLEMVKNYDIIINASSVGMNEDKSPIEKEWIHEGQIIFDIVYSPMETQLIKDAKEKGAEVIYGYEMLLYQGVEQFKMYTKYEAPVREMEKALLDSM